MYREPLDIAKYILFKFVYYGDVITNLKMQKILYFIYVWHLVTFKKSCFKEKFQAWPNGPVLVSVYNKLKKYGSSQIESEFSNIKDEEDLNVLKSRIGRDLLRVSDKVLEVYGSKSAFELVSITHNDLGWLNARKGLGVVDPSNNEISDEDIINFYGKKEKTK